LRCVSLRVPGIALPCLVEYIEDVIVSGIAGTIVYLRHLEFVGLLRRALLGVPGSRMRVRLLDLRRVRTAIRLPHAILSHRHVFRNGVFSIEKHRISLIR
jgi:hypothetical protein